MSTGLWDLDSNSAFVSEGGRENKKSVAINGDGGKGRPRESKRKRSIFIVSQNFLVKKAWILSFLEYSFLPSPPAPTHTHIHMDVIIPSKAGKGGEAGFGVGRPAVALGSCVTSEESLNRSWPEEPRSKTKQKNHRVFMSIK